MGVDFQLQKNEMGAENSWGMGEGEAYVQAMYTLLQKPDELS